MRMQNTYSWPIFMRDRRDSLIYLTEERWEHALDHPGMHTGLLESVLKTVRQGKSKQDAYDPTKRKYTHNFQKLLTPYTHIVVVVKFGWRDDTSVPNNFILTAYLVEKW